MMKFFNSVLTGLTRCRRTWAASRDDLRLLNWTSRVPGTSSGFDRRDGEFYATKYALEVRHPGDLALTDIQHVAGIIGPCQTPVR